MTQVEIAAHLCISKSSVERYAALLELKTARTGPRAGKDHPSWDQGRHVDKHAYILVYAPMHPYATKQGLIREHRLVMELTLGRYLDPLEVVDHVDNHPWHNWPENLELYACNADHLRGTLTGRAKSTPRSSILGAYGNNQKIDHRPALRDTLGQSYEALERRYTWFLLAHRPKLQHIDVNRQKLRELGPWTDPWCPPTSKV
jgi:hypothetical protein